MLIIVLVLAIVAVLQHIHSSSSVTTDSATVVSLPDQMGKCPRNAVVYTVDDTGDDGRRICVDLSHSPYIEGYQTYYRAPNQTAGFHGSAGCLGPYPYEQAYSTAGPRLCVLAGAIPGN